jgi:hypothetical protein
VGFPRRPWCGLGDGRPAEHEAGVNTKLMRCADLANSKPIK